MLVRFRVKASPYRSLKNGTTGEVVGVKFIGTPHEVWRIRLDNGTIWTFYPDELETLNGDPV